MDYHAVPAISNEEKEKLSQVRPATLGAAGRYVSMLLYLKIMYVSIPGIRPSTLLHLLKHIKYVVCYFYYGNG